MLIGAIDTKKREQELEAILHIFNNEYHGTNKVYYRYLYYTLLSETNTKFVNRSVTEQIINELYQFFKMSYYDEKWIYIFSETAVRIFSKLTYKSKNHFRNLIIKDIRQFIDTELQKSEDLNLDDSIIHVINQLHLYNDTEYIRKMFAYYSDFADKVEAPDFTEKYYGLVLYFLEWFSQVPIETAQLLQSELKQVVNKTSAFFIEERTKVALLYEKYENAIKDLHAAEKKLNEIDEENSLPVLQKLCASIFLTGHLYQKDKSGNSRKLIEKLQYLSQRLENELEDEFRFEDFDYNSLVNLSIQGMAAMNEPELYDSILSLIVATEPAYLFLHIPDNKAFLTYLKQLITEATESFELETFGKLLFAIRDTDNARNSFALFRDDFFRMINEYVQNNKKAFNSVEGLYTETNIENDEEYLGYLETTTRFNRITEILDTDGEIFSYDKKFLIDKMLEHGYDKILFFRRYLIPRLLADDFNYFQSTYWEMLLSYSNNFKDLVKLLSILDNEGAYYYEANLPYLHNIYLKIVQNINSFSNEQIKDFVQFFIKITANLLVMLKKSNNSEYIEKIIPLTGIMLSKSQLIASFKNPEGISSYNGEHLTPYILQYYFTNSDEFDLKIDYDKHTEDYKRERMQLLHTLLKLFTKNEKPDLIEIMALKPILGESFTNRIQQYLDYNSELLKEFDVEELENLIEKN